MYQFDPASIVTQSTPVGSVNGHGTAIIVGAAVLNGLELAKKRIGDVKICTSGAGAAAIACPLA